MSIESINNLDLGIGTVNEILTLHNLAYFGIGFVGALLIIKLVSWLRSKQ